MVSNTTGVAKIFQFKHMSIYYGEKFAECIKTSFSIAEVLRKLDLRTSSANYKTIRKYIKEQNLDTTHFDPYAYRWEKGSKEIPLEQCLVENSRLSSFAIKRKLFKHGLKKEVCEICGILDKWNGKKLNLQLDHINGIPNDHRIENLRIVCPNCHSQTETFSGSGKRRKGKMVKCKNPSCKKEKYIQARYTETVKYCSRSCYEKNAKGKICLKNRKVERPPFDILKKELEETNFSAVGRKYGVSDNAVRKWVKWYSEEEQRRSKHLF